MLNKFKKFGRVLAAAFVFGGAALGTGCIEPDMAELSLSHHMYRVPAQGGEFDLRVMSNDNWTSVSDSPEWLNVVTSQGYGSVDTRIVVDVYNGVENSRTGHITFNLTGSDPRIQTVTVTQTKFGNELLIDPQEYIIGAQGGNVSVAVTSNIKWRVTGTCDWATFTPATGEGVGTIVFTVQPNKTGEPRTAEFSVSDNGTSASGLASDTFTLTQKANPDPIVVMDKNVHFTATLAGVNVPYKMPVVGVNFNMEAPTVFSNDTWLLPVSAKQTDGIWFVEFTPQVNPGYDARSGVISVIIRDPNREDAVIMEQIIVTQDGKAAASFTLFPDTVDFPAEGGSATAEYSTNLTDIKVACWPERLTAKPTINASTKIVSFSATPNVDAEMRSGTIEVVAIVNNDLPAIKRTITVNQAGVGEFTYFVLPETKSIVADGGTFTAVVYSTNPNLTEPTVVTSASWLTSQVAASTSAVSAQGKEWTITFTAEPNQDADVRTATVYVLSRANGLVDDFRTISVIQNGVGGPQITVAPSFVTMANNDAATAELALLGAKNAEIVCSMSDSWVAAALNNDKTAITLTAPNANQGAEAREATLFVTATQGGKTQTVRVDIFQAGNGGAEIDIPKNLYFIDATEQDLTIPALAINGSKAALSSYAPAEMFSGEPALNTADALTDVTVAIAANNTFEPRVGEIILLATNGDSRPQFYIVTIVQKGMVPYTVPEATVTPDNVVFEADAFTAAASQDVIVYNSDEAFTYTVTVPAWLEEPDMTGAAADANGKLTITLTPNKDNLTATPFVGVVTLLVHNGTKTQEISIPVAMKASLTPVYPSAYSVVFPAEAYGEEMAALVNLVGYGSNYEIGSVVTRNNWFTVEGDEADGLLNIYPNTPLAGPNVEARTGEIDVVVTAANDPDYRVAFTITVVQETAAAANVAYAPAFHTVGVRGNVEKYLDEAGMVVDPTGDKVETWFANPDNLKLEVVSGLDQAFVSEAKWTPGPKGKESKLSLKVQTNKSSAWARVAVVNVVARNSWGNVVGHFPVTVMQSGVADPAIDLVAAFVDAAVVLKYASGAAVSDDPTEHTEHYEVDAYLNLADGIVIDNVEIVELDGKTAFPNQGVQRPEPITDGIGWIKVQQPPFEANDPEADPAKYCGWINYEIIDGPGSGFPTVTGDFVSARVKVTLKYGKLEYVIYQLVTVVAPEIPEIGAELAKNEDTIKSGRTDYTIEFTKDMGETNAIVRGAAADNHYPAVIQPIDPATDIQYAPGAEAWLADAVFTIGGASPNSTIAITGIPTNESDDERVAAITITLKADNHQDQKITFVLHQEAWPEIGATLAAYEGWITAIAENTEKAVNTTPIPIGTEGIVFADDKDATAVGFDYVYTDTDAGPHTWLDDAAFMAGQINIEGIVKNDDQETSIDRHADITIHLTKTADVEGYETVFKPQDLVYKLTQKGLLEIGASLVDYKGTITALETSTADADTPIAFEDGKNATVAGFEVAYVGTAAGWMDAAAFVADDVNVEGIDKNNNQEPPYADRHAIITITLTKEGYKNQKLTYELTQLAMEPLVVALANNAGIIGANDVSTAAATDGAAVAKPIAFDAAGLPEGAVVAGFAVEYTDHVQDGTVLDWLGNDAAFVDSPADINITNIDANDTVADRHARITITVTHPDYQPATLVYELTQKAMPVIGAAVPSVVEIAWNETEAENDITYRLEGRTPVAADGYEVTNVEYLGSDTGWLDGLVPAFIASNDGTGLTLAYTGIPNNASASERHAIITVKLTKAGYQDQISTFYLSQLAQPEINAVYDHSYVVESADTELTVVPLSNVNGGKIAASSIVFDPTDTPPYVAGGAWVGAGNAPAYDAIVDGTTDELHFTFPANLSTTPNYIHFTFTLSAEGYKDQTVSVVIVQKNAIVNNILLSNIVATAPLGWQAGSFLDDAVTFTDNLYGGGPATVTVAVVNDADFAATDPGQTVGTAGQVYARALKRNASGFDLEGEIILKATAYDGSLVEYYPVTITQATLTRAELVNAITPTNGTAGLGINSFNVARSGDDGSITATYQAFVIWIGGGTANINFGVNDAALNDFTGAITTVAANNNQVGAVFNNASKAFGISPNMLIGSGVNSKYVVTISVDSVHTNWSIDLTSN